jgi:hypothetical protein
MITSVENETHWYDCFYCSPKKCLERRQAKWEVAHATHVRTQSLMEEERKRQEEHKKLKEKHEHVRFHVTPLIS